MEEDHELMEEDHELMKEELRVADDEEIILRYLRRMIVHGDSWPELFKEDADVFSKNPEDEFDAETPVFVIVNPRAESCGKTDGSCESGCWRITGRDKPIRYQEENGKNKIIGFKKILKFCKKTITCRTHNRKWVMEEYRLAPRYLNWKQDHVICKIRFLFASEISSLLHNHLKTASVSLPENELLPAYGYNHISDLKQDESRYMLTISDSQGEKWPRGCVTNNWYDLHPLKLVDLEDELFRRYGICFFADLKETLGQPDKGVYGYWRMMERDALIKSEYGFGFKNVYKFYETGGAKYLCEGEDVEVNWTIDEYRLFEMEITKKKVLCVLKAKHEE